MNKKIRVNITVDKEKLEKAKTKLGLFGGKLSTLFNAYLSDFVSSMEKEPYAERKELERKLREIESRLKRLEDKK
jgi:predicted ribosome quality control (RQC) complex YloA/Tae2 family protein